MIVVVVAAVFMTNASPNVAVCACRTRGFFLPLRTALRYESGKMHARHTARRVTALVLAIALAGAGVPRGAHAANDSTDTLDDLRARYPGLPMIAVSPEAYRDLLADPLVVAEVVIDTPEGRRDSSDPDADLSPQGRPPRAPPPALESAADTTVSIFAQGAGSVSSRDAAIVVFVLAGTVVVAAAVIYPVLFITSALLGPDELPPAWWEGGGRAQVFSGGSQQGYLAGATLAFGLADEEADVGVVVEGGYLDADVVTVEGRDVSLAATYIMAGPTVRWRLEDRADAPRFESELLAGTAEHYDLVSRASFAFTWSLRGPWRAGLRIGAVYLNVDEDEGPIWEAGDDFNFLAGIETAVLF